MNISTLCKEESVESTELSARNKMLTRRYQRFSDTLSAGRDFKLIEIITATKNTDVMTNVFSKVRWSHVIHETVFNSSCACKIEKIQIIMTVQYTKPIQYFFFCFCRMLDVCRRYNLIETYQFMLCSFLTLKKQFKLYIAILIITNWPIRKREKEIRLKSPVRQMVSA